MLTYKIPINELYSSEIGTQNQLQITVPAYDHSEVTITPNQKITITGMKIEDGVCFYFEDQSVQIQYNCTRCLKPITSSVPLRNLEKQYYTVIPEDVDDDLAELIDKKNFVVNLLPFIEETLELSIPTILTCGDDCPGPPTLTPSQNQENQANNLNPFSKLKDLLK